MTPILHNIAQAMNLTLSGFEKMQKATGKNLNIVEFEQARAKMIDIGTAVKQAEEQQEKFNKTAAKAPEKYGNLLSTVGKIGTMIGGFQLGKSILSDALNLDEMESTFQARLGDSDLGSSLFAKLQQDSKKSAFGLEDLAQNTSSFLSMTTDPSHIDGLNKIAEKLAIFDTTGQGLAGAGFSLKEAMTGDVMSLAERFNMSKSMIRSMDIDTMGKNGDVDGFIRQFNKLLDKQNMGEEAYQKMLKSPKTQLTMLQSNLKSGFAQAGRAAIQGLQPLMEKLNALFASDQFQTFLDGLSRGFAFLAFVGEQAFGALEWIVKAFAENGQQIMTTLAVLLATILIPQLWSTVVAIGAQAAAWLASPATWIVLGIVAAVAVLITVLQAYGVTTEQICGFVGGVFGVLFALVYNNVACLWNAFAAFGEFLVNIFIDPAYAIKKLFWDLTINVLGLIGTMMKGLQDLVNTIPGVNVNLTSGIDNLVNSAEKQRNSLSSDKKVVSFARMEQMDYKDSFTKGYQTGSDFSHSLDEIGKLLQGTGLWNTFQGKDTNVDHVNSVGKVDKEVDISSEDLKMMRELAEIQAIQNFVSLQPNVTVQTGDIHKEADAQEIITVIAKEVEKSIVSATRRVYT